MARGDSRSRSPLPGKGDAPGSRPSETGRRRSFSFLGRSKSSERARSATVASNKNTSNSSPAEGFLNSASTVKTTATATASTVQPKRSFSNGNKLVKRQVQREVEQLLKQAKEDVPAVPPVIPSLSTQPQLQTFGGEDAKSLEPPAGRVSTSSRTADARTRGGGIAPHSKASLDMGSPQYGVPVPPVPERTDTPDAIDGHGRSESMTNRGRYSYASSFVSTANTPRRVRRRKDPTPFNVLVLGAANSGKTSFIEFLRTSCSLPAKKQRPLTRENSVAESAPPQQTSTSAAFTYQYLETELSDGERIGLTLWDSEGLESNIVDLQLRDITSFIEAKFEETFSEENKVVRSPGARDTHIHCVFYVLDPLRLDLNFAAAKRRLLRRGPDAANGKLAGRPRPANALLESSVLDDSLDLQVLRTLRGKTTVIPVISKADTVTGSHMHTLKRAIWSVLKQNELDPLEALGIELDEERGDDSSDLDDSDDITNPGSRSRKATKGRKLDVLAGPAVDDPERDQNSNGASPARARIEIASEALPPFPLSILTPDPPNIHHNEAEKMPGNVGRTFPWGFADPYDEKHCDFLRLKEIVLSEWRAELREKSRDVWYENWRTARLRTGGPNTGAPAGASRGLRVPKPSGSRSTMQSARSNPNMHAAAVVGTPPAGTPVSNRRTASPMVATHPLRNASPAVIKPGAAVAENLALPAPSPPFAGQPRERAGSGSGFSSIRPASPIVATSAASRLTPQPVAGEDVTALPPVSADEVGVAR